MYLRYLDRLTETDGGWRIAERKVVAAGVEGFEGVEWVWVGRQVPPERAAGQPTASATARATSRRRPTS